MRLRPLARNRAPLATCVSTPHAAPPALHLMMRFMTDSRAARGGRLPSAALCAREEQYHDRQDYAKRQRQPAGKLADAELHFTEGPLEGLKLIGFSIWERRGGAGGRNVTFPARSYSVNGERRSFALLRPIVDTTAQNNLRELVLEAFQELRGACAIASWIPPDTLLNDRKEFFAFSCCRFGGSVHSSRSDFSNSA